MKKRILTLGIAAAMIFGSFNTPVFFERTEVLAEENSGGGAAKQP